MFALLTGVTIAAYTLSDKYAVATILVAPLVLDWGSNTGRILLLTPVALRRWDEVREQWRDYRKEVIFVAVLSPLAYIMVLFAMSFSPVSYVAPMREISTLIGTFMGVRLLSEGHLRRRLGAASIMALGVIALGLG
jgi:drug/metabolite transporter (DMT)-like permease